ncbi:hypothetical protein Q7C36_007788 [Tachysurus vachellii]|uniref:Uncharacterized protein n=1 Tax=Tachysurus vachellii TaxID=175792 RepID=A0AA88T3D7_TACVA|nr:hypothetical protein Q7C36_007788 [Tachysurus vachellii]
MWACADVVPERLRDFGPCVMEEGGNQRSEGSEKERMESSPVPSVRGSKQVRTLGNKGGYCHMCEISCAEIKFSAVKVSMKGLCPGGS